jgi:hypothetical protein
MCECEVCKYGRLVEENLEGLPSHQKEFFADMYERLCSAEFDTSYYRAILDGSWPSAKSILANALTKCEGK